MFGCLGNLVPIKQKTSVPVTEEPAVVVALDSDPDPVLIVVPEDPEPMPGSPSA